jgi:thiamine biosynthesis lipoprotein
LNCFGLKNPGLIFLVLFGLLGLGACDSKKEHLFYGKTMGTTYHVKVVTHGLKDPSFLKNLMDRRLEEINQSMSTYIKDSEISRFNQNPSIHEKHSVSNDFFQVMTVAQNLFKITGGAWDGTVKPLVEIWGFTAAKEKYTAPGKVVIEEALSNTGLDKIHLDPKDQTLQKMDPDVTLDLASIAKGYGVDQIAKLIQEKGYSDFIVEIGGEVAASGKNMEGGPWKIGINTPDAEALADEVYKTFDLENRAMATSGDYRNFIEMDGVRYSHILDPRTGYPINNQVVSVTIVAENCTFADGLATAVMVLGPEDGLALVNRLDNTEGLIITRDESGVLTDHPSKGFIP